MKLKSVFYLALASALLVSGTASAVSGDIADRNSSDTDPEITEEEVSALPSKVDLRDRGVVPPVKSQTPWGTCWGFGSIAASEISILSDLGLTYDQFREKYGYDMDLSERHLAWFGTNHMPDKGEDDLKASEIEIAQSGEGMHNIAEDTDPNLAHLDLGGFALFSSSVFSAGFGPELENDVPYTANDGTMSRDSDWSVSEDSRFISAFDLTDSSIFPSPAINNDDGSYTYNEAAADAIKQEINNGHAVSICYHGDISRPEQLQNSSETADANADTIAQITELGYSEEDAALVISYLNAGSAEGMSDDEKYRVASVLISLTYGEDADERLEQLSSGAVTPDDILNDTVASTDEDINATTGEKQYINLDTYAQYTYDADASVDHMVCIIGYDDDYAVENFLPNHQPPAPGAWIVRNSWGPDWGNDGYFYLSYYDKTISSPESFVFDVSDVDNRTDEFVVLNYAYMQISAPYSFATPNETPQACIYNVDTDEVLSHAGIFTAVQDTDVVLSVYLLNEDAADPDDGKLLDQQTLHCDFAGYHKIKLTGNYLIPADSRISIVVSQTHTDDGTVLSIVPLNVGTSYEGLVNTLNSEPTVASAWYEATVNPGESYAWNEDHWMDWTELIDQLTQEDEFWENFVIDNPSLKLYLYPFDELQDIHHLDTTQTDENGNTVSVCDEDDYTVIY